MMSEKTPIIDCQYSLKTPMPKLKNLDSVNVSGKQVLVRVDLNVPMKDGQVYNDARVRQTIPTITELLKRGASVILASHMGRPKGERVPDLSLNPVAEKLRSHLPGVDVIFVSDVVGSVAKLAAGALVPGQVLLLENLRFEPGEEANDSDLAAKLATLADIYVDDAFSCAHRAHASVQSIARLLPSVAGRLMEKEIEFLSRTLDSSQFPLAAVIGGKKISTKMGTLEHLVTKVQHLVIGGAMANTFLYAKGFNIGNSLCETQMTDTINNIYVEASSQGCEIILPQDVVVAETLEANIESEVVSVDKVPYNKLILDIGPLSITQVGVIFERCMTVLWNGPLGAFEVPPFDVGTTAVATKVAELTCAGRLMSVAGGGDTVAALECAGVADDFSYISMGGGAFLEWLEGGPLPGVAVLES